MLQKMSEIVETDILAKDGEIGRIDDFYFDDRFWTLRYFVVETGTWLSRRKVLIAPEAVNSPDWENKQIPVNLTQKQIEKSPPTDWAKPVSRQYEIELNQFFNWMPYWLTVPPHLADLPEIEEKEQGISKIQEREIKNNVPQLRSAREVVGYYIHAQNGDIGHVEDMLVDDENWQIRYLLIDTRNWLPGGKKVLVAINWIDNVVWAESKVYVEITREVIRNSPAFEEEKQLSQ